MRSGANRILNPKHMEDKKVDPHEEAVAELLGIADAVPGLEVEMDPEDAARAGAFQEDALTYEDAVQGSIDRLPASV